MNGTVAERVLSARDSAVFLVISLLNIVAIVWLASYWFSLQDWKRFPLTFSLATIVVAIVVANHVFRWILLPFMRRPRPIAPPPGLKIAVATAFVPDAEALDMLAETLRALVGLNYPHDTWVLDEGDSEDVRRLCEELGAFHFSRKTMAKYQAESGTFESYSKHGNYNAWLYEVGFDKYDFLAAFDVDHVPQKIFLDRVLGYFEDPNVAYVQAAQAYYNQRASFIARGAAEETYEFYSVIEMANYGLGSTVIIGSHNTQRMAALKQVGGFSPHAADDLLLTSIYRLAGWQGVYVPEILARGLAPVDWAGYLVQQRRWARAIVDLKFRTEPKLASDGRLSTKIIGRLRGLYYLQPALVGFFALLVVAIALATGITPNAISRPNWPAIAALVFVFQLNDMYRQRFYLDRKNEAGWHWRPAFLRLAKWPFIFAAAIDVVLNRRYRFALTPKTASTSKQWLLLIAHGPVIAVLAAAWFAGVSTGHSAPLSVQCVAAAVMLVSFGLICTEHFRVVAPFERELAPRKKSAV